MNAQSTIALRATDHPDMVAVEQPISRKRYPLGTRTQILVVLGLAAFLDYITGPLVSAAAFYIFPVAFAGWVRGTRAAMVVAAFSVLLSAAMSWVYPDTTLPVHVLVVSQALHAIVYAAVAFLSTRLRHEQHRLQEQSLRVGRLNAQMASEMHAARHLQKLLFVSPPNHPGVDLATFSATARILGGDTLDVAQRDNHLAILVGDVSGKGSPAALAAAVLAGLLDDCPTRFDSPARTLAYLNERLVNRLPPEMFITALYLILDTRTGRLTWANAGHEHPFLLQAEQGRLRGIGRRRP